jgi:FkbM family methyltransferase
VVFSTLVQPADFDKIGLAWWYVGPRNGHISLFSRQALREVWNRQGFKIASFNDNLHIAFRKIPSFAKHLVPDESASPSFSPLRKAVGENVTATSGTTDGNAATEIKVAAPYQLVAARHGVMLCNANDFYMGKALITYGECCETETQFLNQLAQHGGMVVEVGANMGIHTIPLARFLASQGRDLTVFEPQPVIFQQLCANLALNGLTNVRAWPYACGAEKSIVTFAVPNYHGYGNFGAVSMEACESQAVIRVPCVRVDEMVEDERVGLLKIDVEGFERKVLEGAAATIRRCRPLLYVENDRVDHSRDLIEWLWAAGYRLWWHMPFLFNPKNYFGASENLYGGVASFNMVGIPQEMQANVRDLKAVDDASFHPLAALEQQAALRNG